MRRFQISPVDAKEIERLVACVFTHGLAETSPSLVELINKQPPEAIFEIESKVGQILGRFYRDGGWFWVLVSGATVAGTGDAPLLMFNRNGYVREESLKNLNELPRSAFFVAALIWRMNDWVEPVRKAALECANRILPSLPASTIVGAVPFLLGRIDGWSRWGSVPDIVISTLARADCLNEFTAMLTQPNDCRASAVRAALRLGLLDNQLLSLAQNARRPEHRAVILKSLINCEVTWVSHYRKQWVDKRYNISRRVAVLESRPINSSQPIEDLIRQGAVDRNPIVNKVAANGLVKHAASIPNLRQLMSLFENNASPSIKSNMEFLSRQLAHCPPT